MTSSTISSSATSVPPQSGETSASKHSGLPVIIGAALGGALAVAALGLGLFFCLRWRRRSSLARRRRDALGDSSSVTEARSAEIVPLSIEDGRDARLPSHPYSDVDITPRPYSPEAFSSRPPTDGSTSFSPTNRESGASSKMAMFRSAPALTSHSRSGSENYDASSRTGPHSSFGGSSNDRPASPHDPVVMQEVSALREEIARMRQANIVVESSEEEILGAIPPPEYEVPSATTFEKR